MNYGPYYNWHYFFDPMTAAKHALVSGCLADIPVLIGCRISEALADMAIERWLGDGSTSFSTITDDGVAVEICTSVKRIERFVQFPYIRGQSGNSLWT
jgi:hypothetical protein